MNRPDLERRRHLVRWARIIVAAGAGTLLAPAQLAAQTQAQGRGSKRLVAYYSRTGHTRQAARAIAEATGADVFEIVPATPYPAAYQDTVDLNARERAAGQYPGVARLIPELGRYEFVFLGYPIWAMDLPRLLYPLLEQQDFAGKAIAPFCTSAFSGLSSTEQTLARLCRGSRILPGLSLPGGGRGHNTLVTRVDPDARQRAEQWSLRTAGEGARR
ncbi:MAG TPA: flavodoxin [Rubrivivax sp.]|nr:flavodoxin [Rubrivivax sp.]